MYNWFSKLVLSAAFACAATACSSTKNVVYLQDIEPGVSIMVKEYESIKFEPGDRLQIVVHSRDPEIVRVFNLLGDSSGRREGNSGRSAYTVDAQGYVDMPILGRIRVEGLTRAETCDEIKYKLLEKRLVKDPVVTVEYDEMGYYMLGEITRRGRYAIKRDHVTLLEAIAEAGDLTIEGRRDNILVLRTENGKQTPYRVSLLETGALYSSPVYYLRQNDIVYVEPNLKKSTNATVNGSAVLTPGFWISMFSFALSLVFLFAK